MTFRSSLAVLGALGCAAGCVSSFTPDAAIEGPARDASTDAPTAAIDAGPEIDAGSIGGAEVADVLTDLYCYGRARSECVSPWRCGCGATPPPPDVVGACVADAEARCRVAYRMDPSALEAGAPYRIDEAMRAQCEAMIAASIDRCDRYIGLHDFYPCFEMLETSYALGEHCSVDGACGAGFGVCRAGLPCTIAPTSIDAACRSELCASGFTCIEGRCRAPRALGEPCEVDAHCAAPNLCVGGECGSTLAPGEACTDDARCPQGYTCQSGTCREPATPCARTEDCEAANGTCVFPEWICRPRAGVGEACLYGDECARGLGCAWDERGDRRCVVRRGEGESCVDGMCAESLRCVGGTCRVPEIVGRGESCETAACADGLTCEQFTLTCVPLGTEGTICAGFLVWLECGPGLGCADEPGEPERRCRRLPGIGEDCANIWSCADNASCAETASGYRCVAAAGSGEPCEYTCASPDEACFPDFSAGQCRAAACDR